jgi:putative ABC transport system permease protein
MWMLFIGELRRRWFEYVLVAAAVSLVVAALVAHRAVTASAESSVHELAHRLGRNMLVVPAGTDLAEFYGQRYGPETIPDGAPEMLQSSAVAQHIRSIEARLYGNVSVNGTPLLVVGQDLGWPALGDVEPVVLGPEAARATGLTTGQTLRIGDATYSVLQVADVAPDGLDAAVFMPLASAQRILGRANQLSALRLGGCWCRVDVATLAADVERILPGTRAITVAGMLSAQKGSVATMQRYSGVLDVAGVGIVAVVVGTLIASQARRRTRELGLLVAIGAPPGRVAWMLTLQAVGVGVVGGIVGWLTAFPLTNRLGEAFLGASLSPGPGMLLPAVVLAALVSAVAASIPARRAAALDPTVVLREN